MNIWLVAAIALLAEVGVCGVVCVQARGRLDALVATQFGSAIGTGRRRRAYAAGFDREDRADLGRRALLIGLLPLRIWRAAHPPALADHGWATA